MPEKFYFENMSHLHWRTRYYWNGMKADLQNHKTAGNNCLRLQQHRENEATLNAVVNLYLHGPFESHPPTTNSLPS